MKENPYLPAQYRILGSSRPGKGSMTLKANAKLDALPGQYAVISLSGIGETPLYISSSGKNVEFLFEDDVLSGALSKLGKGDKIGIRGPYGAGLPVKEMLKKELVLIAHGPWLSPIMHLLEYLHKSRKTSKGITIYASFQNPTRVYVKQVNEWSSSKAVAVSVQQSDDDSFRIANPEDMIADMDPLNALAVVSVPQRMLSPIIMRLLEKGFKEKQIYAVFQRTISCGIGKCGRCLHKGRYLCKDGPFMRWDIAKGLVDG